MKAVKVTPKLLIARVEVAKVAQLMGLSCKCGTKYTLCCGLARVRMELDKIVPKIRHSPKRGVCAGGYIPRALQRMQSGSQWYQQYLQTYVKSNGHFVVYGLQ